MSDRSQYPTQEELEARASKDQARQQEIKRLAPGAVASPTVLSAPLIRVAKELRKSPEDLSANIPAETIRRTKFPVLESRDENGLITYKEPPVAIEGVRGLVKK